MAEFSRLERFALEVIDSYSDHWLMDVDGCAIFDWLEKHQLIEGAKVTQEDLDNGELPEACEDLDVGEEYHRFNDYLQHALNQFRARALPSERGHLG